MRSKSIAVAVLFLLIGSSRAYCDAWNVDEPSGDDDLYYTGVTVDAHGNWDCTVSMSVKFCVQAKNGAGMWVTARGYATVGPPDGSAAGSSWQQDVSPLAAGTYRIQFADAGENLKATGDEFVVEPAP